MHHCSTLIVHCIDFRLQKAINKWLEGQDLIGNIDRISIAGGVKNQDFVLEQLSVSVRLHGIERVILVNHEDCGAYGPEASADSQKETEQHSRDLAAMEQLIRNNFPNIAVEKYFLRLSGEITKF